MNPLVPDWFTQKTVSLSTLGRSILEKLSLCSASGYTALDLSKMLGASQANVNQTLSNELQPAGKVTCIPGKVPIWTLADSSAYGPTQGIKSWGNPPWLAARPVWVTEPCLPWLAARPAPLPCQRHLTFETPQPREKEETGHVVDSKRDQEMKQYGFEPATTTFSGESGEESEDFVQVPKPKKKVVTKPKKKKVATKPKKKMATKPEEDLSLGDLKIQDIDIPDFAHLASISQEVILVDMSSVPQALLQLNNYANHGMLPAATRVWGFADAGYNGDRSKSQASASRIKIFRASEQKENAAHVLMIWEASRLLFGAMPYEKFALFVVTRDQQFSSLQELVEQTGHTLQWAQDWDQLAKLITLDIAKEPSSSLLV